MWRGKKNPSIKYPLFSVVSKHLDRKKSYASEAVRTRGALHTVNRFFKVAASVWKHPELSEQCEVWGLSAEKNQHFQGVRQYRNHFTLSVCLCVGVCKGHKNQISYMKLSSNLSKGTSNKREDCKRFTGGKGGKNKPSLHSHTQFSFIFSKSMQSCRLIFWTSLPTVPSLYRWAHLFLKF